MTATPRTDAATALALLGGTPVRPPEPPRPYPVWSEEGKQHVARLLDESVALGLSRHQPEIDAIENALAEYHDVRWALGTSTGNGPCTPP